MKRSLLIILVLCLIAGNPVKGQGLLKKVTKSMTNELLGKPQEVDRGPEPACACDPAEKIFDLGGKIQLDYKELSISVRDDGAILLKDRTTGNLYISKDGVTTGPVSGGDNSLTGFESTDDDSDDNRDIWMKKYPQYITKTGEKYLITFGGKSYGPYAIINNFAVTRSRDKFAALVVENILITTDRSKSMEKEMDKAKTDQEKMDLAMKYAEEMQKNMMANGGPNSMQTKIVSSIPDLVYDPVKTSGGILNGDIKYDEIVMNGYGKIMDLQGNTLMTAKPEAFGADKLYLNTANTKYVFYNYGTLNFSDGKILSDLFNPGLIKTDGKIYLTYMYYSPKKNSIMRCRIEF